METHTGDTHRMETHVDDDSIPGTEVMKDHDGRTFVHAAGGGPVLVPQPSNNRDDPLNWSPFWKTSVAVTQSLFVFNSVMGALSIAPMNGLFIKEWGISEQQVGMLTGACVLSLGYANFIIVPMSNIFGRRQTSLVFCILCIVMQIWEAVAKTHGSFLGARILTGVATAINESMMVQVIADTWFIHQRGRVMGLYFAAYFGGLFIGPVISGNMADSVGWRPFFWLMVGLSGLNLVTLLVGFPETRYRVASVAPSIHSGDEEKSTTAEVEHAHNEDTWLRRGRPSRAQWALWQPIDPNWRHTLWRDVLSPWAKFFNPIILWAGMVVNGSASMLLWWNLTEPVTLGAPPYNWTPRAMGFAYFALLAGGLIGLATAGALSDWICKVMTIRNGHVREAEFRLLALIPYSAITIVGLVVGAVGFSKNWSWPIELVVGYGAAGLSVTSVPTIAVAYAVDCYTPIAGDIMVVATVFKNTIGFAMSYWVYDVIKRKGIVTASMVVFALFTGPVMFAIPLWFWGKRLRRWTRHSHWHRG